MSDINKRNSLVWSTAELEDHGGEKKKDDHPPDASGFIRLQKHAVLVRHGRLDPGNYKLQLEAVESDGGGFPPIAKVKFCFGFIKPRKDSSSSMAASSEPQKEGGWRNSISRQGIRDSVFGKHQAQHHQHHLPRSLNEFGEFTLDDGRLAGNLSAEQVTVDLPVTCYSSTPVWVLMIRPSKTLFKSVSLRASLSRDSSRQLEVIPIVSPVPSSSRRSLSSDSDELQIDESSSHSEHALPPAPLPPTSGHSLPGVVLINELKPASQGSSSSNDAPSCAEVYPHSPLDPKLPTNASSSPLSSLSSSKFTSESTANHKYDRHDEIFDWQALPHEFTVASKTIVVRRLRLPKGTNTLTFTRTDTRKHPTTRFKCELTIQPDETNISREDRSSGVAGEIRVVSFGQGGHRSLSETVICPTASLLVLRVRLSHEPAVISKTLSFSLRVQPATGEPNCATSSLSANVDVTDTILLLKQNEPLKNSQQFHYALLPGTYHLAVRHAELELRGPQTLATARAITASLSVNFEGKLTTDATQLVPAGPTWKRDFIFTSPADLTIELTPPGFPRKVLQVSYSVKLVRLPDALSAAGIERRTRKIVPIIVAVITIASFLSWFLEQLQYFLTLSLLSISVRSVLFVLGLVYLFKRRDEAKQLWIDFTTSIRDTRKGFEDFDEATGLQKLQMLAAKGERKKKRKAEEARKL